LKDSEEIKQRHKKRLLSRLARVEGQIRAIRRMIESDSPCEIIAQQLSASRSAMNKAHYEMIACALEQEVLSDTNMDAQTHSKVQNLTHLLSKYS
jgi:DNA-binding FrmR family transcriptional regulator